MKLDRATLRLLTSPRMARVEAIVNKLKQLRESSADPLYGRGAAPYGFGGGSGGGGAAGGAAAKPAAKPPTGKPAPKPESKPPAPAPGAK